MKKFFKNWKFVIGILISIFFMFLSFRKVEFGKMVYAFTHANFWYVPPTLLIIFFSHWLRAIRWQFFLLPIQKIRIRTLFSSLLIGYMANTILPAHLGELLRAYMVSKKYPVPAGSVFGTIVTERLVDVLTLLILMAVAVILFPFPEIVRKSGYLTFAGMIVLFVILLLMKKHREKTTRLIHRMTKPFAQNITIKVNNLIQAFLDGFIGLAHWRHYLFVAFLSVVIWACYALIFQIMFYAFDFVKIYSLPWHAALILLVITTISVLVPSSPGYVGTYHWLCLFSLGLFAVPKSPALTYAIVVHGLNFIPILIVGLVLLSVEEIHLSQLSHMKTKKSEEP
jgi:glycosyltransferase 2 family protein